MRLKKTIYIFAAAILIFTSCSRDTQNEQIAFNGLTMGTTYSVKVIPENSSPELKSNILKAKVDSVLTEVNDQMSTFIPESEISLFNRLDRTDWFNISEDFAFVLNESIKMCKLTGSSLDITIAPIVNIWGFGPEQRPHTKPSDKEISANMEFVGIDNLHVKFEPLSVKKDIPNLQVDLSSTAKGFGVDKVFNLLSRLGYKNIMVEIGGEVRAAGKNQNNEIWKIGISTPDQSGGIDYVVKLDNLAMATSGNYWNYFEENGIRYSHTIDPKTGRPITHKLASVTVLHPTCLWADGLATGIFVMGPEKGYDFAVKNELPVYMIVKSDTGFIEKQSPKFIEIMNNQKGL